jgi:hypothetical protein
MSHAAKRAWNAQSKSRRITDWGVYIDWGIYIGWRLQWFRVIIAREGRIAAVYLFLDKQP